MTKTANVVPESVLEEVRTGTESRDALSSSTRRLAAVLNNTRMAVFIMDETYECVYLNAAAERLTGYRMDELRGRPLHDVVHHTRPDGRPFPVNECPIGCSVLEHNHAEGEELFIHKDGHFYPVAYSASPICDDDLNIIGTVLELRDIREEKGNRERMHLLVNELNHRVKNTLATVQSIVRQSHKSHDVPPEVQVAVEARLMALARSHDLLTREAWDSAGLKDVVHDALAPFGIYSERSGRFRIEGPNVRLSPNVALALALGLHELATNAVKYGALSNDTGSVHLIWDRQGGTLHLTWEERDGPLVAVPTRRGFGSRLIQRGLAQEVDGTVELAYPPEGVRCTMTLRLDSKQA